MWRSKVSRNWPGSNKGARSGSHTNEKRWLQENGELIPGNKRRCTVDGCGQRGFTTINALIQHYESNPDTHSPPPAEEDSPAEVKEWIQNWLSTQYNYTVTIEEVNRIVSTA
ncbi:predicted protein [Lichtheimia corymbifera JMRC:FSU:9682]|uniref:Uncharacterized protein n=1 Tax=Lichtheimia corymbifera JMRC:FSU:9682 TaxID=1263082 RepID=A0A068RR82_9FUNG|nr:predicted protein [Lichtheimia corymbifera JMRC:FSU:9682]